MTKIIPFTLFMFLVVSCKDNTEGQYSEEILGKWSVVKSELNNKPSKSMESAFFNFEKENKVISNIFQESKVPYTLEKQKLTFGSHEPLVMDITYLENDSMVLEGNYSLYFVRFYMKRDSAAITPVME